jgi:2-polyprenyl-6-hydroxyphenyl methylase/3-demethylubiquinone-9 3-methyltransferase
MIDNEFYKDLGERWYEADGGVISLLRLENEFKTPWVLRQLPAAQRILDIGCGGGFLTLALAAHGHRCTGLDVDERVFAAAQTRAGQTEIEWVVGRAHSLPFADASFDAVCLMDVLEHLNEPGLAVVEAARVLKPGGRIFFHTFNRTWLSWLVAAKGLDWFLPDSPAHVHDWALFLTPVEVQGWLDALNFRDVEFTGIAPKWTSVVKLMARRRVPENFEFTLGGGLAVGYLGTAIKKERQYRPEARSNARRRRRT